MVSLTLGYHSTTQVFAALGEATLRVLTLIGKLWLGHDITVFGVAVWNWPSAVKCFRSIHPFLLAFFLCPILGQASYVVRNWTSSEGLPQNSVTCLLQTSDGYLWLGTFGGLVRFDGIEFVTYTAATTPAFKSSWINTLHEDKSGALWIGTRAGLIRSQKGIPKACDFPSKYPSLDIYQIIEAPDKSIHISTDRGFFRMDGLQGTEIPLPDGNWPTRQSHLIATSDGKLWAANSRNLYEMQDGQLQLKMQFSSGVSFLTQTSDGRRWAILENKKMVVWNQDGNTTQEHDLKVINPIGLYQTKDGTIWITTFLSGLLQWKNDNYTQVSTSPDLETARLLSFLEDREGNIWLGSDGQGLHRLLPTPLNSFTTANGLGYDDIAAVLQDTQGTIWAGAFNGGLNVYIDGVWKQVYKDGVLERDANVTALCKSNDGTLWVGCYGGFVCRLKNGILEREPRIELTDVRTLYEDLDGGLWFGSESKGLFKLDAGGLKNISAKGSLSNPGIRATIQDASGALWIGTENGLNRYANGSIDQFFVKDGLGANFIQTLFIDHGGTLWIGSDGGGLTRYHNGRFETITTRHGLAHNTVSQILEDENGHLWLGSHVGLTCVSKRAIIDVMENRAKTIVGLRFGQFHGMRNPECAGGFSNTCLKDAKGKLWFSTVGGLVVADPEQIQPNPWAPPVHIERLVVNGDELADVKSPLGILASGSSTDTLPSPSSKTRQNSMNSQLHVHQTTMEPIRIPPGAQKLEIYYSGLNSTAPEQVQYQYQLVGYDDAWQAAGPQRVAHYTRLPPGTYRFQVKAGNNQGIWNETAASLVFKVQPFFWQTIWFRSLIVLIAVIIGLIFIQARLEAVRKTSQLRLRIAQDLHDEIGSSLSSIALLSELAEHSASSTTPPKQELAEIRRIALKTVQSVRDVVWFISPEFDTVGEMSLFLENVAGKMLSGRQVQFRSEIAQRDRPLSLVFRREVCSIFKETLHNIVKHSGARRIDITLNVSNSTLELNVRDDGRGYDTEQIVPGNGLRNLKRRAAELRGNIEFRSNSRQGTEVLLRAPLT